MPTRTLNIPVTTLPVGQTILGPMNVGNNSQASIVIDRTVDPGGLNLLGPDTTLAIMIQISPGGSVWNDLCGMSTEGGLIVSPIHGQQNTSSVSTGDADTARQVRVLATVTGPSPIAVAGTVTVT